jgi:hypothetical protein
LVIDAIDLFTNTASFVYYDDMSLVPAGEELICDTGRSYFSETGQSIQLIGVASSGTTPYT